MSFLTKWTLFLIWAAVILLGVLLVVYFFFPEKLIIKIGDKEIANAPFWKLLVAEILLFPILWICIAALRSQKALEEFKVAEPVAPLDRGPLRGPGE